MPLRIAAYKDAQKDSKVLTPLRAAGLAVERGHVLASERGLASVKENAAALSPVFLGGQVGVREGRRWRRVRAANLEVALPECRLALSVVLQQREFLSELGLNVWAVDSQMPGRLGFHDLVADGSTNVAMAAYPGLVSVELKLCSAVGLTHKLAGFKQLVRDRFASLQSWDQRFQSQLLLVSVTSREGREWAKPELKAFNLGADGWQQVGRPRLRRGRIANKRPLPEVFSAMQWHEDPDGGTAVGLVSQFLEALGQSGHNAGERVAVWNSFLGYDPAFEIQRVAIKAGRPPWAATKAVFRRVYKLL